MAWLARKSCLPSTISVFSATRSIGLTKIPIATRRSRNCAVLFRRFHLFPSIVGIEIDRLPQADAPFEGAPDWVIEIRSPDQSILDLQNKILHCLTNGTQLAWLVDIQREQIWVWQAEELPMVYAGTDILPGLAGLPTINVAAIIAMTQHR
jgi:Uma2 family endonuclease